MRIATENRSKNFVTAIEHKKLNMPLSKEEIKIFTMGAALGNIPDYQLAAMLMAIRLNGMNNEETSILTIEMRDSGDILDLSDINTNTIDKHSTGGVSDGTSLVIAPLVAAVGAYVPMVSGRALGHTGGTLDKLESIPGFNVNLTNEQFIKQVKDIGLAIIGQTSNIAPADKKLYALRDVTSTVDCIPLIASSILSKKLASGTRSLVLDVKTGSGAMMTELEKSKELAKTMVAICKAAGVNAMAFVTDMNQPLGTYIGNSLEIEYAIRILKGQEKGDYLDICLTLASNMLIQTNLANDIDEAKNKLIEVLNNGKALEKLRQMIIAQGGDPRIVDDPSLLPHAPFIKTIKAETSGYIEKMDVATLGNTSNALGAGRDKADDQIDHSVGFILPVRIGDKIDNDTTLCTIYAKCQKDAEIAEQSIKSAITISNNKVNKQTLIYDVIV